MGRDYFLYAVCYETHAYREWGIERIAGVVGVEVGGTVQPVEGLSFASVKAASEVSVVMCGTLRDRFL